MFSNKLSNYHEELNQFRVYKKINKKKFLNSNYKKPSNKENINNYFPESENKYLPKNKKVFQKLYFNVKKKEFYKDGKVTRFNLFKENEIGLNGWDKKIDIRESEEDYDSDDEIVGDGIDKIKEDLKIGLKIFKKKNFKEIVNYGKYRKYNIEV